MKLRYLFCMLAAVILAACSDSTQPKTVSVQSTDQTVVVPFKPERVVVFDIGTLDTLHALNIQVSGLPDARLPEALAFYSKDKYVKTGTLFEPQMDVLTELKPDLIIVAGRSRSKIEELSGLAPTIDLSVNTADFKNSLFANWKTLGTIFGREKDIDKLITATEDKIKAVRTLAEQQGTALQLMTIQERIALFTPQSRFGFIYDELGFKPAIEVTPEAATPVAVTEDGRPVRPPQPTAEELAASDPDWIFVFDRGSISGEPSPDLAENPAFAGTKAVTNQHIVSTDPIDWYIIGNAGYDTLHRTLDQILDALQQK